MQYKFDQNIKRNAEQLKAELAQKLRPLEVQKRKMQAVHAKARTELKIKHYEDELTLRQKQQSLLKKGLRGLWQRITGKHRYISRQNERETYEKQRQRTLEMDNLIFKQLEERLELQKSFDQHQRNYSKHGSSDV